MLPAGLSERYELLGELGAGGMGQVFRARDLYLGREVAVKVMLDVAAAAAADRQRFLREAEALSRVRHPNLVQLFDHGVEPEGPYLVMELLEGASLDAADAPPLEAALQVADALQAIHEAGLVHRDVKPANVLWTPDGRAVLLDFGIVRDPDAATLTQEGYVLGTVPYMAPEVLREIRWDPACDWYALGATLYELTHGRPPWESREVLARVSRRGWPAPALGTTPADRVAAACLREDPAQRPHGRAALEAAADGPLGGAAATATTPVAGPTGEAETTQVLAEGSVGGTPQGEETAPRPGACGSEARARRSWLAPVSLALLGLVGVALIGWRLWAPASPPEPVTSDEPPSFLHPEVAARLRTAIARHQLGARSTWTYQSLWDEVAEVQSFRGWLAEGGQPEDLSEEVRARLRAADAQALAADLPPPFHPYVYELDAGEPDELPEGAGPWLSRALVARRRWQEEAGVLTGQLQVQDFPAGLQQTNVPQVSLFMSGLEDFLGLATADPKDGRIIATWARPASRALRTYYYALGRSLRTEAVEPETVLRLRPSVADLKVWFHGDLLVLDLEAFLGAPGSSPGLEYLRADMADHMGRSRWALAPRGDLRPREGLHKAADVAVDALRVARAAGEERLAAEAGRITVEMFNRLPEDPAHRIVLREIVAELAPWSSGDASELARKVTLWVARRRPGDATMAAFLRLSGDEQIRDLPTYYPAAQQILEDDQPLRLPREDGREAYLHPAVASRLAAEVARRGLPALDPARHHRLWDGVPEVQDFRAWLRAGHLPEELSETTRARLREADRQVEEAGLPRPFFPYVYELPAGEGEGSLWMRRVRAARAAWAREVEARQDRFENGELPEALSVSALGPAARWMNSLESCLKLATSRGAGRRAAASWMRPVVDLQRAWLYAAARAARAHPDSVRDIIDLRPAREDNDIWFYGEMLAVDAWALHGGRDPSPVGALLLAEFLRDQARARWELSESQDEGARAAMRDVGREVLGLFRGCRDADARGPQDHLARVAFDIWKRFMGEAEEGKEAARAIGELAAATGLDDPSELGEATGFAIDVVSLMVAQRGEESPWRPFLEMEGVERQEILPEAYAWARAELRR